MAELGFCLPGSRPTHQPLRPYLSWTRKVGTKTVTRNLTAAQANRYQPWFNHAKRLRQLTNELEALSIQTAAEAEGWDRK
jgi:hypothetical protein